MPLEISRNFDVSLRMLRENPAIFIPSLASLLLSFSIIALTLGVFLYVAGISASSIPGFAVSNPLFAIFLVAVDLFLILGISAYFDSISLYMVRQAWRKGSVDLDDCFSRGGMYAVSLIGVELVYFAAILVFGAGVFFPLFFSSLSYALLSVASLFFLVLSSFFLYWRRESVVLRGKVPASLSFSCSFSTKNVSGTVLLAAFLFLLLFTIDFFGESLAGLFAAAFAYLGFPAFFGDAVALAVFFMSLLFYGALSRTVRLCVFLDANR